jgi:hypothetical protein
MKGILLIPLLLLISCHNDRDETALFQDAYSAVFESFADLGIKDPSVFSTLDKSLDKDVIRQDLNTYHRETFNRMGFDIEQSIGIWKKYKGIDLSAFVAEEHLHLLVPKDSIIDRRTVVSFSAPVFNSDTSYFIIFMISQINEENRVNRSHQYLIYGKEQGSWKWMMATSDFPDN